jgi:membrane fusion protein (multidrug efflux system)
MQIILDVDRSGSRPWRHLTSLAACLSMALLMSACGKGGDAAPAAEAPPAEVTAVTLEPTVVPVQYGWVAQTDASRTVEIRARVPGFLIKRPFEEGGLVDEGDLLFQIDQRGYEADLEVARARLAQAEAALSLADVTLKRTETAAAQGGTNQQEVDEKRAKKREAEAAVRLAKGNVSKAELDLSYTTMLSPLNGRIGKSPIYEGAYVDSGANSLLATVVQSDPIYVEFSISERELLDWQKAVAAGSVRFEGLSDAATPGMTPEQAAEARRRSVAGIKVKVSVSLVDGTMYPHQGELNFVDITINPTTGTAQARAVVPNPDWALRPGQFVRANLLGWERPNTLVVPQRSVIQQPTGQFVYVVGDGDKAELRGVKTGQWFNELWIIEEGLKPGERVVVDGLLRVQPGAPLKPTAYVPAARGASVQASETPAR